MINPDELYHYGVLGMKWGQRNVRRYSTKAKKASARAASAREGVREGQAIARSNAKKGKSSTIVNRQIKGEQRAAAKFDAKAKKYSAKSAKIENKHISRAGGKKAYNYTKNKSTGNAVVKSMLMGTYGAMKYNEARSKGVSRGKAALTGTIYQYGNLMTAGLASVVEPRMNSKKRR